MLVVLLIVGPTAVSSIQSLLGPRLGTPPTRPAPLATPLPAPPEPIGTVDGSPTRLDQWPEDLDPSSLVYPATEADANYFLDDNPLYGQSLQAAHCPAGALDLASATGAQLDEYLTSLVACLMDVWASPVRAAGYVLPRPSVTVYEGDFTTKCGQAPPHNAFYCGADQQLYYSADLLVLLSPDLRQARFVAEAVVAHEFGHAIQARTGILTSEAHFQDQATSEDEGREWSRRTELQADCFAGLFLRAIGESTDLTAQDAANAAQVFYQMGDTTEGGDHGQRASRANWFNAGANSTQVGACQTFTAPADQVA